MMIFRFYNKWVKRRNNIILSLLQKNPDMKVIDLGCGDGNFTSDIKNHMGCKEIWGVDISASVLEKAKKRGIIVIKSDLDRHIPLQSGIFDVVISNQVIEHLVYPVRFLKEIYRILKPNGYAVLSTENLSSWDNLAALLFGFTPFSMQFDSGYCKIGNVFSPHNGIIREDYNHPHLRIFSWRGLIELVRALGFRVSEAHGSGHILGNIGEFFDRTHSRFITIKISKIERYG